MQCWMLAEERTILWPISLCLLFAEELVGAASLLHRVKISGRRALVPLRSATPPMLPHAPQQVMTALRLILDTPSLASMWERLTNIRLLNDGSWEVSMLLGGMRLTWLLRPLVQQRRLCAPPVGVSSSGVAEESYRLRIAALAQEQAQSERYAPMTPDMKNRACAVVLCCTEIFDWCMV
jgi:hypothetical protein